MQRGCATVVQSRSYQLLIGFICFASTLKSTAAQGENATCPGTPGEADFGLAIRSKGALGELAREESVCLYDPIEIVWNVSFSKLRTHCGGPILNEPQVLADHGPKVCLLQERKGNVRCAAVYPLCSTTIVDILKDEERLREASRTSPDSLGAHLTKIYANRPSQSMQ